MRKIGHHGASKKISGVTSYSTYSLYAKTVFFLRYAAAQPEPSVALVDDDVFIQPAAFLGYAWALLGSGSVASHDGPSTVPPIGGEWYAGRFDWYSWRTETLQATAYWRGLRGALFGGMAHYRNCSPTGNGWIYGGKDGKAVQHEAAYRDAGEERCVGPFAFAKGPMAMLSSSVVRWLVVSSAFERDTSLATRIAAGFRPRGLAVERVPQDVQMGYWLAQHPTLRYVSIPRKLVWADAFVEVTDLSRLLIGHRIPWDQIAWLTSKTQKLWAAATPRFRLKCGGPPCPSGQCSHARGQLACAAELTADTSTSQVAEMGCLNCVCWEGAGASRTTSGGACNFSRAYVPKLPAHCLHAGSSRERI